MCFCEILQKKIFFLCSQMVFVKNLKLNWYSILTVGKCKINRKRVDRLFGEWKRKVIETHYEWKEFMEKTILVEAAHGGKKPSIPVGQTFVNFRFITYSLYWTSAKSLCEGSGGQLFYRLDGTVTTRSRSGFHLLWRNSAILTRKGPWQSHTTLSKLYSI